MPGFKKPRETGAFFFALQSRIPTTDRADAPRCRASGATLRRFRRFPRTLTMRRLLGTVGTHGHVAPAPGAAARVIDEQQRAGMALACLYIAEILCRQ